MPVVNQSSGTKAGTVNHFASSAAPNGWLKANGALVSRSAYAALFAVIGTTFGAGDGSTTFALPDLRGIFLRNLDDGRGVDSGRAIGSFQSDAFQGFAIATSRASSVNSNIGTYMGTGGATLFENNWILPGQSLVSNGNGTPRTAAETRPSNVSMLACIKY